MSMEYIRNRYAVPAEVGMRVTVHNGRMGTIVGADGGSLRVRLDGDEIVGKYHPTWAIEYCNGLRGDSQ